MKILLINAYAGTADFYFLLTGNNSFADEAFKLTLINFISK